MSKEPGTERIVLVQCTNTKLDQPCQARNLYAPSTYYRKQRAYAETVADQWYIQSAKYGLVDPDRLIEPYNRRAKDLNADERDQWATHIADDVRDAADGDAVVEILGGRRYADPLTPELEARGFDVIEPLRGLGIGERMSRLDEMQNQSLTEASL